MRCAIGSPQLLLLSGIGPARQLRALGIDPMVDLPDVGEHLQDHPIVVACYASDAALPRSEYNHAETYAALSSPLAGDYPDLHLFPELRPVAPAGHKAPAGGYALVAAVVAPASTGSVRLADADLTAAPLIDPGFLARPARRGSSRGWAVAHPPGRRGDSVVSLASRRGLPRLRCPH